MCGKKIWAALAAVIISVTALSVTAFAAEMRVPINEKYFPDEIFREYVSEFDTNGDNWLSQNERDKVTEIDVSSKEIGSLKGIEKFKNLETLDCHNIYCLNTVDGHYDWLTELDVSQNTKLKKL